MKEYDEETNLRCLVMLDASGSMEYGRKSGSKFEYAAGLSAALGYLMLAQTESVGLAVFRKADRNIPVAARWARGQLARLIEVLERSGPRGESSLSTSLHDTGNRLDRQGAGGGDLGFLHACGAVSGWDGPSET